MVTPTNNNILRGLIQRIPDSRQLPYVGLALLLLLRIGVTALLFVHAIQFDDKKFSQSNLTIAVAYGIYCGVCLCIWIFRPRDFGTESFRKFQIVFDVIFSFSIASTGSGPSSLAFLMYGIAITLTGWYYTVKQTIFCIISCMVVSIFGDFLYFKLDLAAWINRVGLFAGIGTGVIVMRRSILGWAMDDAKKDVQISGSDAYLINSEFTLLATSPSIGKRHGDIVNHPVKCHEYLAHSSMPCPGCPMDVAIKHDSIGEKGSVTLRDNKRQSYLAEITASRVRGHDGAKGAQGARAMIRLNADSIAVSDVTHHERIQSLEHAQIAGAQIEALFGIGMSVLEEEDRDLSDILARIREHLSKVINVDNWYVALFNRIEKTIEFPAYFQHGTKLDYPNRDWSDHGLTEWVIARNKSLPLFDKKSSGDQPVAGIRDEFHCRTWIGVPLHVNDCVFGAMAVQSEKPCFYNQSDLRVLEITASQIALALARLLYRRALMQVGGRDDVYGLFSVAEKLSVGMVDVLLAPMFTVIKELIGYDTASLQRLDGNKLRIVASDGFVAPEILRSLEFDINGEFPNSIVCRERHVLCYQDVKGEFKSFNDPKYHGLDIRAWLGVPLIPTAKEIFGVLTLDKMTPRYYDTAHERKAIAIAPFIADRMVKIYEYLERWVRANRYSVVKLLNHYISKIDLNPDGQQAIIVAARLITDAFGVGTGCYVKENSGEFRCVLWLSGGGIQTLPPSHITNWVETSPKSDPAQKQYHSENALCVPIRFGARLLGYMCIDSGSSAMPLSDEDFSVLQGVANILAPCMHQIVSSQVDILEDLLDVVKDGALSEDLEGRITFVNDPLLFLLGYRLEEIKGRHFLDLVPKNLHQCVKTEWHKRATGIRNQYETELITKHGKQLPVWVDAKPNMEHANLKSVSVIVVDRSLNQHTQKLHSELANAARILAEDQTTGTGQILRTICERLAVCGLQSVILRVYVEDKRLRIHDLSINPILLARLKREFNIQLHGLELDFDRSPAWQEAISQQRPIFKHDAIELLAGLTTDYISPATMRRLTKVMGISRAIVLPASGSGDRWILSVWGNELHSEDIAPIADFWRIAVGALLEAEARLNLERRSAPQLQLHRMRFQMAKTLYAMVRLTCIDTGCDSVALFGLKPGTNSLYTIAVEGAYASTQLETYEQPSGKGLAGWAAATGQPRIVGNVWDDPYFEAILPEESNAHSEAVIPIKVGGFVVAILDLQSRVKDAFRLPSCVRAIHENARKMESALGQLLSMYGLGFDGKLASLDTSFGRGLEHHTPYALFANLIAGYMSAEECALWLTTADKRRLALVSSKRLHPSNLGREVVIGDANGIGLTGYVGASRKSLRLAGSEIRKHPNWRGENIEQLGNYATGQCDSILAVPVFDLQNRCIGVLKCENKIGVGEPPEFTTDDDVRLQEIASLLGRHLPLWQEHETIVKQIDDQLRLAYRDQIHNTRGEIYAAAYWGLDDLLKHWKKISEPNKRRELRRAFKILNTAIVSLERVESEIIQRTAEDGRVGPVLRIQAAEFGLAKCTMFEGCIDSYRFSDARIVHALNIFGSEALSNARKYSRIHRNRSHQIHVQLEVYGEEAILSVQDHGIGLPSQPGPTAFQTLRNAVEQIGGRLEISTGLNGRGTCVTAYVPLARIQ